MSNSLKSDDEIVALPESDASMTSSASEKYGFESLEKQQPDSKPLQCALIIKGQSEKEAKLKATYSKPEQKDGRKSLTYINIEIFSNHFLSLIYSLIKWMLHASIIIVLYGIRGCEISIDQALLYGLRNFVVQYLKSTFNSKFCRCFY